MPVRINFDVINKIEALGSKGMEKCYNCGYCVGICPMELDILPRKIFRYALLGVHDKLIEEKEMIFSCLLCKRCEESCPCDVPISENIRILRHYINCDEFKL